MAGAEPVRSADRQSAPELKVREALATEYPEVARVTVAAYRQYASSLSPQMWSWYQRDLADVARRAAEAAILVAEHDGRLVGAVAYFPPGERDPEWFAPENAFLRVLAVLPEWQGQGIGRRLTEACIARARADGAPAIGLMTTQLMPVAKAMYERMGFQQQAEYEGEMGGKYWVYLLPLRTAEA